MKRLLVLIHIAVIAAGLISQKMHASAQSINQSKNIAPAARISPLDRLFKISTMKGYLFPPKQEFVMPVIEYNDRFNSLLLLPKNESFSNVQAYNLSPDKKLLFIETTGSGIKLPVLPQISKKIVPEKITPQISVTNIIDTQSGKQIATFNDVITYKFSPDQTMLLIGQALQKTLLKTKYAETFQYNLFDTASQSVVKTLSNVQAIDFTPDNKLIVQYNNGTAEKMNIKDIKPYRTFGYFIPKIATEALSLQDKKILQKFKYDLASRTLTITPTSPWKPQKWSKISSYYISPDEHFILAKSQALFRVGDMPVQWALDKAIEMISKEKNTVEFLSMKTGEQLQEFPNVISYEFNPINQVPARLLIFNINNDTKKPYYQLIDSEGALVRDFENVASAYFDFVGNLVVMDQKGKMTLYDAIKGISLEEKEQSQKLQEQREQERLRRENSEEYMTFSQRQERQQQIEEEIAKRQQELYAGLPEKLKENLSKEQGQLGLQEERQQKIWEGLPEELKENLKKVELMEKEKQAIEEPMLSEKELTEIKNAYARSTAPVQGISLDQYIQKYKEKKIESLQQKKELQEIQKPLIEQGAQKPEVLPAGQPKQSEKAQTIQDLMTTFVKVQAEFPQGLESLEDIDKSIAINEQLKSIVANILDRLTKATENERLDLFEIYNNFDLKQKKKFSELFFASSGEKFNDKQNIYSIYSSDGRYRADRIKDIKEIGLWTAKPAGGWLYAGEVLPNKPKEFSKIIRFRFITPKLLHNLYLFFIDENYDMGVINVRTELDKLQAK